jgi:hypothetical protein
VGRTGYYCVVYKEHHTAKLKLLFEAYVNSKR